MFKKYGDRVVLYFNDNKKGAEEIIKKLRTRKIICKNEIKKLCLNFFKEDLIPCVKTVLSLFQFKLVEIDEREVLNSLLSNVFPKDYLLYLLDCGTLQNKVISPEAFIEALNFFIVKEALKKSLSIEIEIHGSIDAESIKKTIFLAKKAHFYVDIRYISNKILIKVNRDEQDLKDKTSTQYRLIPDIFATILSLANNWKMTATFGGNSKLKLRSNSYWFRKFTPPWVLLRHKRSFDSLVEKIVFDSILELDIKVERESKILIRDGIIFIPDFIIEHNEKEYMLEIVGFWTKKYLNKKEKKLNMFKPLVLVDKRLRHKLNYDDNFMAEYSYPPNKEEIKRKILELIRNAETLSEEG